MFKNNSSFLVLYTTDIESTHSFYKKLGAEIKQVEKDKVVIHLGSFDFHFILNTTEPFEAYRYIAEPKKYGQGVILYIETDDIKRAQELIVSAGGKIIAPIFKDLWESEELLFEDPNGYKFALYQEL